MNIKRSYFQAFAASTVVALLLANCTVKESNNDECDKGDKHVGCDCPGGLTGYQQCNSQGVFGSCICPDTNNTAGSGNHGGESGAGSSSEAGAGGETSLGGSAGESGGSAGAAPAETGGGGEGGAASLEFEDCESCLIALCADEFQACLDDKDPNGVGDPCISEDGQSGQYVDIANCINAERVNGLVKRDVVRNCGVTLGASATDASLNDVWAPQGMRDSTTNLLNCLATSSKQAPNADWANSDDNYPVVNGEVTPTPWPADSCAKLACTAKFE